MGIIFSSGITIALGIYETAQNKLYYQSIFSARQNKTSRMLTWYILNCSLWFGKYMTSSMLCMYEMEIYGCNEYYIGYFCCTLYLVLLCWTHWSRRSAETGSSLFVSGSHLSFPGIPVTAASKEACFRYEDIDLCKKHHFHVHVYLNLNHPAFVTQSLQI